MYTIHIDIQMNEQVFCMKRSLHIKKNLYFRFCKQAEFVVKTDDDWVIDLYGTYTVARDISSKKKRDNVNMY